MNELRTILRNTRVKSLLCAIVCEGTGAAGSGTVTSVGAPAFHTVSNPTTTPTFSLDTQSANLVLAGPASGAAAAPAYRALVKDDISGVAPSTALTFIGAGAAVTMTNQPNSEEYLLANSARQVIKFDASKYTTVLISFNVFVGSASANTPRAYLKYKTSYSSGDAIGTWTTVGSGGGGEIISLTTAGCVVTTAITLDSTMKGNNFWTIATNGGDATADPQAGSVVAMFML